MNTGSRSRSAAQEMLYEEAECKTNQDSVLYLVALALILMICNLLNEIGVFEVVRLVMRVGTVCGVLSLLAPVVLLARPLRLFRRTPCEPVYRSSHKYLILLFTWLGTTAACVTLTHHAVILMSMPIMLMAQYRDTKKLVPFTIGLASVCVLLSVYGGYFWGCFDANLLRIGITDTNTADLSLRLQLATTERMRDLFTHYVLPRELIVLALTMLASGLSRRSDEMLGKQVQLQAAVEAEMTKTNEMQWRIIDGMANLIENRDPSTGGHVKRTSFYVRCIVEELQGDAAYQTVLTKQEAERMVEAAPLHDIGKIVVSDSILQKPGRLTTEEYEKIKQHAAQGAQVIDNVLGSAEEEAFLSTARQIACGHHERWDGAGYPAGLNSTEIPLSARIMAVADVFDALVSERVYKSPMAAEEAFTVIEKEAGKQFDPAIVAAFCRRKPQILRYLTGASTAES